MNFFAFLKNGIYLILIVFLAFLGLQYGLYGLIVNLFNNELRQVTVEELSTKGAGTHRYIEVSDGINWDLGLAYMDERGKPKSYLYFLSLTDTTESKTIVAITKSYRKIEHLEELSFKGMLEPFWYKPDKEIVAFVEERGFKMAKNNYFINLNEKPWKWYYNLLILGFSILFFYRLFEAITKGIREKQLPDQTE